MPRYNKKITRLMDYREFVSGTENIDEGLRRSLLELLYLSGCRIQEALNLHGGSYHVYRKMLHVNFLRLKGSQQTDPQEIPMTPYLEMILERPADSEIPTFPFSYKTSYREVKKVFPELYPHYFRMNWITTTSRELGDVYVQQVLGLSSRALDHYRGKVSIKKVGEMWKNIIAF